VQRRQCRPVQARLLVMRGVVAAIEHQPVVPLADEVAGVIVLRAGIAVDVLDEVDAEHRPQRKYHLHSEADQIDQRAAPEAIQPDGESEHPEVRTHHRDPLHDRLPIQHRVARPRLADVLADQRRLEPVRHEKVSEHRSQPVLPVVAPGDAGIPRPVQKPMVIAIVGRDPAEDRRPVEHRQPNRERRIGRAPAERRAVVMIVRDGPAHESQVERQG
jgi:hypothetical protein